MSLKDLLVKYEGIKLKPYRDTQGKTTIGVGRNLDDDGISQGEAMMLLDKDIEDAFSHAEKFHWFLDIDSVRQDVIVNMIFNLGTDGFSKFQKMIAAIEREDYHQAASEMLNSAWATEVHERANELSGMMFSGQYPTEG